MKVNIRHGYVFAETEGGEWHNAGIDRTFGVRDPQGARYRCNCGAHFDLPRDIAGHLGARLLHGPPAVPIDPRLVEGAQTRAPLTCWLSERVKW